MEHGTRLALARSMWDPNCTNHYFGGIGIDNTYLQPDLTRLYSGAFHFFIVFMARISWGLI